MAGLPKIVIYPGEGKNAKGITVGTLQILNGQGETYEVAAGPPPGKSQNGEGGHTAAFTPPGEYVLGSPEHHITANWPSSVVPWGAAIRESNGVIEYQVGSLWKPATGEKGAVTSSVLLWHQRSNEPITLDDASKEARTLFFEHHRLVTTWLKNDFGNWSWNLKRAGHRTPFYIHTTPEAEYAATNNLSYEMQQSHGCIHIRPADRDEMRSRGYLHQGIKVEIIKYGSVHPK